MRAQLPVSPSLAPKDLESQWEAEELDDEEWADDLDDEDEEWDDDLDDDDEEWAEYEEDFGEEDEPYHSKPSDW